MRKSPPSFLSVYSFPQLNPAAAYFSGRKYTHALRQEFLHVIGLKSESLKTVKQVHGCEIVVVKNPAEKTEHLEADGFLTDQKEVGLGILTADCIPVFFYVPGREVIGLAHAGWRGLKADILVKMVEKMKALWGIHPKDIRAALGPAIRKCCYEVGPEFHELFKGFCIQSKDQVKPHLDLISFAQSQLLNLGIRPEHCFDSEICTACQNPQFFSWRKENTKERILSVLWLPMAKPEQN